MKGFFGFAWSRLLHLSSFVRYRNRPETLAEWVRDCSSPTIRTSRVVFTVLVPFCSLARRAWVEKVVLEISLDQVCPSVCPRSDNPECFVLLCLGVGQAFRWLVLFVWLSGNERWCTCVSVGRIRQRMQVHRCRRRYRVVCVYGWISLSWCMSHILCVFFVERIRTRSATTRVTKKVHQRSVPPHSIPTPWHRQLLPNCDCFPVW
jgi:hypothetical protein